MKHAPILPIVAIALSLLLGACGGTDRGAMGELSSTPIPAITYDALFVVNGGSNSISVINAATQKVTGTIVLKNASFPHHINVSADRAALVVAVPGVDLSGGHEGGGHGGVDTRGAVLRLDALSGETKAARRLDAPNHNGIFSPDGKEIWTSQMQKAGRVLVLDASTLETRQTIPVGDMPAEVTFSKDGKFAFVANAMSNVVTVIDVATKAVAKTIRVGANPVGAWMGADGVMYVDNEAGKSLTAIDAASLDTLRTYNLGFTPGMAATAPNGELWVTDSENGTVAFYSTADGAKLGELPTGAGAHAMAFSGDGRTAYVSNQTAGTVSVIDVATGAVTKAIAVGTKPNGMVFRPK
jgi:YVTN family beta-propeller protein